MDVADTGPRRIQSLERTCDLIEALRRCNGATISELERETSLTAGSIHTHLTTLRARGYVVQNGTTYRLGPHLITIGEHVRNSSVLYRAAKAELDELASKTGEGVHLFIEHDGKGIAIYEAFGPDAVGTKYHTQNREQPRRHMHCTAYGKAILSALPRERVVEIVEQEGLVEKTPNTITTQTELFEELERTNERGYAINNEEEMVGIRGVGVAVLNENDAVRGAVSISGPSTRIDGSTFEEELPRLLTHVTNVIQVNMQTGEYIY